MINPLQTFGMACVLFGLTACSNDVLLSTEDQPSADIVTEAGSVSSNVCFGQHTPPLLIERGSEQPIEPNDLPESQDVEFETPCASVLTPSFIASLQRALLAREYYRGAITGKLDAPTRTAIELYQIDQNDVPTQQLTLQTTYTLGLIAAPHNAVW